jgi:PAS domain S-box-containing protein
MLNPARNIHNFLRNLGPVEQAQIVASTAVVVTMATIVSAIVATGQTPRFMDFISIVAVGVIGFTSVYFSLQHSRQLDEQRRQQFALNALAEAVNRVVTLDYVLYTALAKIDELLETTYGWIYLYESGGLHLRCARGTEKDFLSLAGPDGQKQSLWLNQPRVEREPLTGTGGLIPQDLKNLGIAFWATVPLRTQDEVIGVLVLASGKFDMLTAKESDLVEAFGNHISVAVGRARLFEQLRTSEQQYADLYHNAPDLYLSIGRDHTIVGCNRTGAELLGYAQQQLVTRQFESLFISFRQDMIRDRVEQMFVNGDALKDVEEQMVTEDGRHFHVLLSSTLLLNPSGKAEYARIVARDISERKKMEATILHAQKIDSIGNLAGGIAHDFNNILSAILGSASIMQRHLADRTKLGKYVEIIESAARRGSSLTRQLLTFARKTETLSAPVDIHSLLRETLDLFERSVAKNIVVQTRFADEDMFVNGDDGQIQQAVLNLCLNARDAMPDGGTLTIATNTVETDASTSSRFLSAKPGRYIEIRVSDTGRGIPEEIANRIFEPFFTTRDNGTGLGLSVVYGVVQTHGGFLNVESTPGQGTEFMLFFPQVLSLPSEPSRKKRGRLPRGKANILVVDDEPLVAEIAKDMLAGLGYTVYIAPNGRDGVDFYRDRQATIDLIILDINMPLMSGKEAFEHLRAINPAVKIVIVTGYGKGILDAQTFSGEVNGFVQKPFQLETLATKVRTVLDQPATQPELT